MSSWICRYLSFCLVLLRADVINDSSGIIPMHISKGGVTYFDGYQKKTAPERNFDFQISIHDPFIEKTVVDLCREEKLHHNVCKHIFISIAEHLLKERTISPIEFIEKHRMFDYMLPNELFVLLPVVPIRTETIKSIITCENAAYQRVIKRLINVVPPLSSYKNRIEPQEHQPRICFIHSVSIELQSYNFIDMLLHPLIQHGLIEDLEHVFILHYGDDLSREIMQEYSELYPQIYFIQVCRDFTFAELTTLRIMHKMNRYLRSSANPVTADYYRNLQLLYMHTKGASYIQPCQVLLDWVDLMLHFLVEKHEMCYHLLASGAFDAIGIEYESSESDHHRHNNISSAPMLLTIEHGNGHFGGNFWWTTGEYLTRVPQWEYHSDFLTNKYRAEFWLLDSAHLRSDNNRNDSTNSNNSDVSGGNGNGDGCNGGDGPHNVFSASAIDGTSVVQKHSLPPLQMPRVYCPHYTTVNHYMQRYPRHLYDDDDDGEGGDNGDDGEGDD